MIIVFPPDSPLALAVGPKWSLLPLCIPGGWAVHHNGLTARRTSSGEIEMNDSEDLFWARKLPPPDTGVYMTAPESYWREIHVDVGWYRDHFRIAMLDPDWDHVRRTFDTADAHTCIRTLERWLEQINAKGDVDQTQP